MPLRSSCAPHEGLTHGKLVPMDFITLDQTINGIAGRIKFPERYSKYANLDAVYKTAEAAAKLHQQLHNLPDLRPKWVVLHPATERPVFDDTAADAGMEILAALAGGFRRAIGADNSLPSLEITRGRYPIPPIEKMIQGKRYRNPFKSPRTERRSGDDVSLPSQA